MNGDFIKRSLRVSIIVTLLFVPFLFLYLGPSATWGFIAGAAWNILNVYLLSQVITRIVVPANADHADHADKGPAALAGLLKFPVLYGLGYVFVRYANASVYGIMAGFSLILIVFVLKALGIYIYRNISYRDNRSYGSSTQQ